MALEFYSGFTRGEYLIALVDFIVALRRTKGRGRRTLRSPPSPSSGLHLIHPGCPLRRGISAAAVYTNLGNCIQVQVDNRQFRMLCSYLCSGLGCSRFSRFCLACIVRFSLVVGWTVYACGYVGFCYGLSLGLPRNVLRRLTRAIAPISLDASPFHQRIFPLNVAGWKNTLKMRSCS